MNGEGKARGDAAGKGGAPFRLMLVTGPASGGDQGLVRAAGLAAAGGADAVQVRDPAASGRRLFELTEEIQAAAGAAAVLVNGRVDVALAAGAAGAHLPGTGLPVAAARRLLGPKRLLGRSCHGLAEAVAAERDGADYLVFGPVFETESKRAFGPPRGLAALGEIVAGVGVPVIAIGGIVPERVASIRAAGASGIAVMSFILAHPRPDQAARELLAAWASAHSP